MRKTLFALAALALAGAAQAQSATYAIDPTHTFVTFEAKHFNFGFSTNRGRFDKKEGTITIDPTAKTGKVEVTIDMGSINTGTAAFDKHLKGPDFFNAEVHPSAKFVGEQFAFDGEKIVSVGGTLTMLGKTLPVTLKADSYGCFMHPMIKRQVCAGDFSTTIKRSQWGMDKMTAFLPDDIRLVIQVEGVKQP
ncbi:YceI family protein [Inhella crocodyli]|uniref:Polyisoprenoid-binding protein n=1 Tax=Inhella crocodyli TaxID=2499851 RepID=A0A437LM71_9BURK|nr:YceI family protein [Inhella crocodyli]RVT86484.1 polyisoprenoid-binding protein [Inhella crocodyli]